MIGTWWPPAGCPTILIRAVANTSWAGADNPNRFYSTQDLFDTSKIPTLARPGTFPDRLLMAGTNSDSYNRYTFYRLLSQLGTDSAPEPGGKMNLNYCNVDTNGYVVPNMATNFQPWQPAQFFTNAAIRLLADAGYTVGLHTAPRTSWFSRTSSAAMLVTNLKSRFGRPTSTPPASIASCSSPPTSTTPRPTERSTSSPTPNGFPPCFARCSRPRRAAKMFIIGYRRSHQQSERPA